MRSSIERYLSSWSNSPLQMTYMTPYWGIRTISVVAWIWWSHMNPPTGRSANNCETTEWSPGDSRKPTFKQCNGRALSRLARPRAGCESRPEWRTSIEGDWRVASPTAFWPEKRPANVPNRSLSHQNQQLLGRNTVSCEELTMILSRKFFAGGLHAGFTSSINHGSIARPDLPDLSPKLRSVCRN